MEKTQTDTTRKKIRELGGQLRLGGVAFSAVAIASAVNDAAPTKLAVMGRTATLALGIHAITKMAGACIEAANHARDPWSAARHGVTAISPLSALFILAVSQMTIGAVSERPKAETVHAPDPLASATQPNFDNVVWKEDARCAEGTSVITFDKATNKTVITTCTAPSP